jgi:hypothetical protein
MDEMQAKKIRCVQNWMKTYLYLTHTQRLEEVSVYLSEDFNYAKYGPLLCGYIVFDIS